MKRLLILAVLLPLAACSAPAAAPSPVVSTATAAATPSPTPTPTPTPTPVLHMGDTAETSGVSFTFSERRTFKDARNVQAFMVKGCLDSNQPPTPFSYMRWTALGPDGERYQPSNWSDIQPSYPAGVDERDVVQPGECVKGWVQFDTPDPLAKLRYTSGSGETFTYELE